MKLNDSSHAPRRRPTCERRGSKRLLCSDLVRLSWREADGSRRLEIAVLENLSLAGVGLFAGVPITEDTVLRITANGKTLSGNVRACRFRENGYVIGVELNAESRWAQEPNSDFTPEHLLDTSRLRFD